MDPKLRAYATDRQWALLEAVEKHGSDRAASKAVGVHRSLIYTARKAVMAKAAQHGYAPDHDFVNPLPDGFKVGKITTLRDMQTGEAKIQWQQAIPDKERQEELIREAVAAMCEDLPRLPAKPKPDLTYNTALMNVIPWGDPHFGLHCWAEEVGEDFDIKIARRDLCAAVDYLISQAPPAPRCVLVNLGDFFHADNLQGMTSRSGNILDMDTRLPKVIRVGVAAMRQAIESALSRHEVVEVINAIGNHDDVLSMALSIMLANIYEAEPRVVIHDAPTRRHYLLHGKVLIGVTHGDQTKDQDLPGIMATERPEWWGRTKHRYFYRGHHHQDKLNEYAGCKVEQFRTLAAGDAYAVGHGYLSGRDMKLLTMHSKYGEVGRTTCSIDLLRDLAA